MRKKRKRLASRTTTCVCVRVKTINDDDDDDDDGMNHGMKIDTLMIMMYASFDFYIFMMMEKKIFFSLDSMFQKHIHINTHRHFIIIIIIWIY